MLLLTVIVALAIGWWLDHRAFVTRDDPVAVTYSLKNCNPKDVREVLRSVYSGAADLEITVDFDRSAVIVAARPTRQVEIRTLIEQLDTPFNGPGNSRIIRLNSGVSPVNVKGALEQVLGLQPK
jgi:Bacterial type II/III secretion system short domain